MPLILIALGSIGWLGNVVIAFSLSGDYANSMSVHGHISNALGFLWVIFGGLVWQWSRE